MTPTRWDHAISIAPLLADSLSRLEARGLAPWVSPSITSDDCLTSAIRHVWLQIVEDARSARFALSDKYVPAVYRTLASSVIAEHPANFKDVGAQASLPWSQFLPELRRTDVGDVYDESWFKYALVLSELALGGHVESLSLSLGWMCMGGLLLIDGQWAIYPPPAHHSRLLVALEAAGPAHWDAEDLRAVLAEYSDQQRPPGETSRQDVL